MPRRTLEGPDDDQKERLNIPVATVSSIPDGRDCSVVQAEYVSRPENVASRPRALSFSYGLKTYEEMAPAFRGMFFGGAGMGFSGYMLHLGLSSLLSVGVTPEMMTVTAFFAVLALTSLIVFALSSSSLAPRAVRVRCVGRSRAVFQDVDDCDTVTGELVEALK